MLATICTSAAAHFQKVVLQFSVRNVAAVRTDVLKVLIISGVLRGKGQNCEGDGAIIIQANYHVNLLVVHPMTLLQPSPLSCGQGGCLAHVSGAYEDCTEMKGVSKH